MARNRRREKSRRKPQGDNQNPLSSNGSSDIMADAEVAPSPLEHATPDVELAEAQMALGRPDLAEVPDEDDLEAFEEEQAGHDPGAVSVREPHEGQVVATHEHQAWPVRLVGFLRGSWAELHRVQWPDRRQVFQATGVVLGFVIVAGAFLGVADLVASKLVNFLITK